MKTYIVDIDGTICSQNHFTNGERDYKLAKPFEERIKSINNLYEQGGDGLGFVFDQDPQEEGAFVRDQNFKQTTILLTSIPT